MNKYVIKVINRGNKAGAKQTVVVLDAAKIEHRDGREAAGIINDWISESRENSRVERLFSDNKISARKIPPRMLTEPLV